MNDNRAIDNKNDGIKVEIETRSFIMSMTSFFE